MALQFSTLCVHFHSFSNCINIHCVVYVRRIEINIIKNTQRRFNRLNVFSQKNVHRRTKKKYDRMECYKFARQFEWFRCWAIKTNFYLTSLIKLRRGCSKKRSTEFFVYINCLLFHRKAERINFYVLIKLLILPKKSENFLCDTTVNMCHSKPKLNIQFTNILQNQ